MEQLSATAMRQFGVVRCLPDSDEMLSMDSTRDGMAMAITGRRNLMLIESIELTPKVLAHKQRLQPELLCFTSRNDELLLSSTGLDFSISLMDLCSHAVVSEFCGHQKRISSLIFRPDSDQQFLSSGQDNSIYLWDLRSSSYTHSLMTLSRPLVAFEPQGLIFAATNSASNCLEWHDVRHLSHHPLQRFSYHLTRGVQITQLEFSPLGGSLLLNTNAAGCFTLQPKTGLKGHIYDNYANVGNLPLQVTYSPDSNFVLAGADQGRIHVWHAITGEPITVLFSNSPQPVRCLKFNPKCGILCSLGEKSLFWVSQTNSKPIIDLTLGDYWKEEDEANLLKILEWRVSRRWHSHKRKRRKELEEGEVPSSEED